jgi:hypothetical protein
MKTFRFGVNVGPSRLSKRSAALFRLTYASAPVVVLEI